MEFGANEQTAAAVYNLIGNDGNVLLRDGWQRPLYDEPTGRVGQDHYRGRSGLSKDFGAVRVGRWRQLVPVDWAGHDPGRTLHLTAGVDLGNFDLDSAIDVGASHFGEVSASYRQGFGNSTDGSWGSAVAYYFGISEIDNGAPMTQTVAGSMFQRAGPPRNDALIVSLTIGFSLK